MESGTKMLGELKRDLGFWDSIALVIGSVVGVGIFRTPSEVCGYLSDPGWVLAAWLVGGIIAFLGTLCYSELASSFPETGGSYVYLKYGYGKWAGFLFGWSEFALMRTASIASVSYAFGEYFTNLIQAPVGTEKILAMAAIGILTSINVAGLHYGKCLQNVVSLGKGFALTGLVILGLTMGKGSLENFKSSFPAPSGTGFFSSFGLALVPILWTYGGWHESTFVAGEFKRTDTDLPFSLLWACGLVAFFYLIVNVVYLYLFPATEIATRNLIAGDVMRVIFGPSGEKIITMVILVCIFGVLNTVILAGGRIPYAVAQDHPILKWFSCVSPKFKTPDRGLIVNAGLAMILVGWGTFRELLFLSAAAVWFFFAAVGIAVFLTRRKFKGRKRPFSMWGYPWTTGLFTAAAFWIFLNTSIFSPREAFLGFSVILAGVPLYWISQRLEKNS